MNSLLMIHRAGRKGKEPFLPVVIWLFQNIDKTFFLDEFLSFLAQDEIDELLDISRWFAVRIHIQVSGKGIFLGLDGLFGAFDLVHSHGFYLRGQIAMSHIADGARCLCHNLGNSLVGCSSKGIGPYLFLIQCKDFECLIGAARCIAVYDNDLCILAAEFGPV